MFRSASLLAAGLSLAVAPAAFAGSPTLVDPDPVIPAAAPFAPASPDWTGGYVGGQLGWGNIDTNVPGVGGDDLIGGLVAGYDYDFGQFVLGAGLDYDFAEIGLAPGVDLENVWRAKLRAGAKIGNGLAYATGGYANADTSTLGDDDGYFIGGGYEHLVSDSFSVGGEVLYHEFNDFNSTGIDVDATTVQLRGTFRF